jgi:hypothetical protein
VDFGDLAITPAGNRYKTIFTIAKCLYVMTFLHKSKDVFEQLLDKAIAQAAIAPKIIRTDHQWSKRIPRQGSHSNAHQAGHFQANHLRPSAIPRWQG